MPTVKDFLNDKSLNYILTDIQISKFTPLVANIEDQSQLLTSSPSETYRDFYIGIVSDLNSLFGGYALFHFQITDSENKVTYIEKETDGSVDHSEVLSQYKAGDYIGGKIRVELDTDTYELQMYRNSERIHLSTLMLSPKTFYYCFFHSKNNNPDFPEQVSPVSLTILDQHY